MSDLRYPVLGDVVCFDAWKWVYLVVARTCEHDLESWTFVVLHSASDEVGRFFQWYKVDVARSFANPRWTWTFVEDRA